MAWSTPLGDDLDAVWARLLAGETGLAPVPRTVRLRNSLVAAVADPIPDQNPAERLRHLAAVTIARALRAAHLEPADPELQLVLGTSLGAYLEEATERRSLYEWAQNVGSLVRLVNPPIAVSTACSSGSDAILAGAELIRAGAAQCCICGGADVLTVSKQLAHSTMGTMSPTTLRAFDVRHDGTLLGEGAAFVVLQAHDDSCEPLAWLIGAGAANDATGMTVPDAQGLGARRAIERSLADADIGPEAIGLIKAHGSGTPMNDASESATFRSLFRNNAPLVFGTKGNFGHSLGATGAIEAVALMLALRSRHVPPIFGLEQPDPDFPLPLAQSTAKSCEARIGMSLTLGFGGFDTNLIFEAAR